LKQTAATNTNCEPPRIPAPAPAAVWGSSSPIAIAQPSTSGDQVWSRTSPLRRAIRGLIQLCRSQARLARLS